MDTEEGKNLFSTTWNGCLGNAIYIHAYTVLWGNGSNQQKDEVFVFHHSFNKRRRPALSTSWVWVPSINGHIRSSIIGSVASFCYDHQWYHPSNLSRCRDADDGLCDINTGIIHQSRSKGNNTMHTMLQTPTIILPATLPKVRLQQQKCHQPSPKKL